MQLHQSSWQEIDAYLAKSKGIIVPIGSTEQHGPNGLLGTDAICPEVIAKRAGDASGILVGPTFNVGQAQHHLAFAGTISLRPSTMIAAIYDWTSSLTRHGFEKIYWFNGHGGNIATITAAFSEIYADVSLKRVGANTTPVRCTLRNWWDLDGVSALCREMFPVGEGSHATASEVSVTYAAYPEAIKRVEMSPKIAPTGPILDADDYRRRFPDGRIGSDPSQATPEKGERLIATASKALVNDFERFLQAV
jgi:creatinine amidohydrolase/Fe(II)-dependent formamide hydrolase-like protein